MPTQGHGDTNLGAKTRRPTAALLDIAMSNHGEFALPAITTYLC